MDITDRRIVSQLQSDARLKIAELGRRVALGYSICAIVRVIPASQDIHVIPRLARVVPEITSATGITGEDCYFMRLYLRVIDDLEPILDRITPHGRTTTSIVHSAPVPPRPLPVFNPPDRGTPQ